MELKVKEVVKRREGYNPTGYNISDCTAAAAAEAGQREA